MLPIHQFLYICCLELFRNFWLLILVRNFYCTIVEKVVIFLYILSSIHLIWSWQTQIDFIILLLCTLMTILQQISTRLLLRSIFNLLYMFWLHNLGIWLTFIHLFLLHCWIWFSWLFLLFLMLNAGELAEVIEFGTAVYTSSWSGHFWRL